ncbi:MAG: hypothetical protein HY671_03720 [Chloroflexi bacterium]|nr:hypothetical protein [Chloroflexota bacterium]
MKRHHEQVRYTCCTGTQCGGTCIVKVRIRGGAIVGREPLSCTSHIRGWTAVASRWPAGLGPGSKPGACTGGGIIGRGRLVIKARSADELMRRTRNDEG